jgi:ketosteroid isomerase-like protein
MFSSRRKTLTAWSLLLIAGSLSLAQVSSIRVALAQEDTHNQETRKEEKRQVEAEDVAAARDLFERYQKLDKACDIKLTDFYAPDAEIESEVERKDQPKLKEKYDREKFCALIKKSFADPAMAKMSAETEYESPSIKREGLGKKAIEVEFRATHGDTAMKVTWLLHKMPTGEWLIAREKALTYRKSIGQAKP